MGSEMCIRDRCSSLSFGSAVSGGGRQYYFAFFGRPWNYDVFLSGKFDGRLFLSVSMHIYRNRGSSVFYETGSNQDLQNDGYNALCFFAARCHDIHLAGTGSGLCNR